MASCAIWVSVIVVVVMVILSGARGRFHARHFRQSSQMPVGPTELGGEKRLDEIPGDGWPDRPPAHAENVEVIVLDALLRGEMVVDERCADAGNLVGADRGADPLPQIATPRCTCPATTASARGTTKSG